MQCFWGDMSFELCTGDMSVLAIVGPGESMRTDRLSNGPFPKQDGVLVTTLTVST
jgi:hypothetical protein